jgi:hypothetical protein
MLCIVNTALIRTVLILFCLGALSRRQAATNTRQLAGSPMTTNLALDKERIHNAYATGRVFICLCLHFIACLGNFLKF